MPNLIKKETLEILDHWEKGLTNLQIANMLDVPVKKVICLLNRKGLKSNRYEIIDESKIIHLLIGSYLGDGHFSKFQKGQESKLAINHGADQKDYLNWKYEKLKEVNLHNTIFSNSSSTVFTTKSKSHPIFSKFRTEGYDNLKGTLNLNLVKDLNSESFSIWYLDDGSVTNDGANITCMSLCYEEKEILKNLIFKNIGLEVNITSNSLYIPKKEVEKFQSIVRPYCINSMLYKLVPYHQR